VKKRYIALLSVSLVILITSVIFFAGRVEWRVHHGYCFRLDKYLTAEELRDKAVEAVYNTYMRDYEDGRYDRVRYYDLRIDEGEELINYESLEDFKDAVGKNCCKPKFFDTWESRRKPPYSGRYSRYIFVKFPYKAGERNGYKTSPVFMDGCGGQAGVS